MDEIIYNAYLNFKKQYYGKPLQRVRRLPILVIICSILLVACAIIGLILLYHKVAQWYWIAVIIELFCTIAIGIKCEEYKINHHQEQLIDYINYCKGLYKMFKDNYIKNDEQLQKIFDKVNFKINEIQTSKKAQVETVNKWMQILFIPIILVVITAIAESEINIQGIIELSSLLIIGTLTVYSLVIGGIYLMTYDTTLHLQKLKYFAEDIQGVLDAKIYFDISDDMKKSDENNSGDGVVETTL